MTHIYRVMTMISNETPIEHGFFGDLCSALECASVYVEDHPNVENKTIVEEIEFGKEFIFTRQIVWEHSPLD